MAAKTATNYYFLLIWFLMRPHWSTACLICVAWCSGT
ncbi:hypothetical protein YpMG051020_3091, partial [Yersinia pestis biovar Orientalis str. MG05-1020]